MDFGTSNTNKKGQTLITLMVFMIIMLTVAASSVSILITNAQKYTLGTKSIDAYYAAEAGINEASIYLLRNPSYIGGTIQVGAGSTAEITVTRVGNGYTVLSTGHVGNYQRTIRAVFDYTNSILSTVSVNEIYP